VHRPESPAGQGDGPSALPAVTPEVAAEAAVWVARMHGPERSAQMERECLAWQGRSATHALAFERCTDTWQAASGVTLRDYAKAADRGRPRNGEAPQPPARMSWVVALVLVVLGGAFVFPWRAGLYETAVGEQRVIVLTDGTRMSLNTQTRVHVDMAAERRSVKVDHGEAYFEVAKDSARPFVVEAAGAEVVAVGTAFLVRSTPVGSAASDALSVTLVEGRVVVRDPFGSAGGLKDPVMLNPGQRIRLSSVGASARASVSPVSLDSPRMDQALAWRRGEVVFDDVALLDALAEMNRYSSRPVVAREAAAVVGLRVSGVFRTGESQKFARALAKLHGLELIESQDRLELVVTADRRPG
jgi:transmembrane sensor